jgi:hypothetical protein
MYGRTAIRNVFAINGTRPDGVRFNNNLCIGKCDDNKEYNSSIEIFTNRNTRVWYLLQKDYKSIINNILICPIIEADFFFNIIN